MKISIYDGGWSGRNVYDLGNKRFPHTDFTTASSWSDQLKAVWFESDFLHRYTVDKFRYNEMALLDQLQANIEIYWN